MFWWCCFSCFVLFYLLLFWRWTVLVLFHLHFCLILKWISPAPWESDLISRWSDAQNQIRMVSFCISVQWKFSKKRIYFICILHIDVFMCFVLSRSWISSSSEVFSWETLKRSEDSTQRAANHSFRQIFSVRSERLTLVLSLNNFDYEVTLNSRATAMFNVWI